MTHRRFAISGIIALSLFATAAFAYATSPDDVSFPIAELGGCRDKQSCRAYCDDITNANVCAAFARKHNLMTESEARRNETFQLPESGGPGGCTTHGACRAYCENTDNVDECVSFAERYNIMPQHELEEYKKVSSALKRGVKLPGNCKTQEQCRALCESGRHMEECIAFAEAAGFLSPGELAEARRIMPLMAAGKMPGGCTSKSQCETYCSNGDNIAECAAFALEAGFLSPEEAEMVKKTGGRGPGGCFGRACEAYCENKANREACVEFAYEHGLMSEEDTRRMQESGQQVERMLAESPPEVVSCLRERIGNDAFERMRSGDFMVRPDLGEHMSSCFRALDSQKSSRSSEDMQRLPADMRACLEERLGPGAFPRMAAGEIDGPVFDQAMRACMELERTSVRAEQLDPRSMPSMDVPREHWESQPMPSEFESYPERQEPMPEYRSGSSETEMEQVPPVDHPPSEGSAEPPVEETRVTAPDGQGSAQPERFLASILVIIGSLLGW